MKAIHIKTSSVFSIEKVNKGGMKKTFQIWEANIADKMVGRVEKNNPTRVTSKRKINPMVLYEKNPRV